MNSTIHTRKSHFENVFGNACRLALQKKMLLTIILLTNVLIASFSQKASVLLSTYDSCHVQPPQQQQTAFARTAAVASPMVRVAYVIPSNRTPQPNGVANLQHAIKTGQQFFKDQMEQNGFGPKTFVFETEADGVTPLINVVNVAETDEYLRGDLWNRAQQAARNAGISLWAPGEVWVVIPETYLMFADGSGAGGVALGGGSGSGNGGGVSMIGSNALPLFNPAMITDDTPYDGKVLPELGPYPMKQDVTFNWFEGTTLSSVASSWLGALWHETGHAFGLWHDFRNDSNFHGNLMGNGLRGTRGNLFPEEYPQDYTRLEYVAALLLNVSHFFNRDKTGTCCPTVSATNPPSVTPQQGLVHISFQASDPDGLSFAYLIEVKDGDLAGEMLLDGTTAEATFAVPYFRPGDTNPYNIFVLDKQGHKAGVGVQFNVPAGYNQAPHPHIRITPPVPTLDQPITLDATLSWDAEHDLSSILSTWDINNDGQYDTEPSTNKIVPYTYASPGNYLVRLKMTDPAGGETISTPVSIKIPGEKKITVESFTLINADNDEAVRELEDGLIIKQTEWEGKTFSVRANTSTGMIDRVEFNLEGPIIHHQVDSEPPYALFGDSPTGNFNGRALLQGEYTLTATPFFGSEKGNALIVSFKVIPGPPLIVWDKTLGGMGTEWLRGVASTTDGGFLLAGRSNSNISGDKSENGRGEDDYWIIKIDAQHNKEWDKTFGGDRSEDLYNVVSSSDGGYLLGGGSGSDISGDKSAPHNGSGDYWVVKIDNQGNKIWDKTFGGDARDLLFSIIPTPDGGYLLAGFSESNISGDKSAPSKGLADYWVVKIDSQGNKIWDKTFGGSLQDELRSITATVDGYLLSGFSESNVSGDKSAPSKGSFDYWVVKIDSQGNKVWDKTFGGDEYDPLSSTISTPDGGFLLAGASYSNLSGDKSEATRGFSDFWVVKIDANGNKAWDKTLGGSGGDELHSVVATPDGRYLLSGRSFSNASGDKSENSNGEADYWIVKIDDQGNKEWDKTLGGADFDNYPNAILTSSGSCLVAGYSRSNASGDKSEDSKGDYDYWIVELKLPVVDQVCTGDVTLSFQAEVDAFACTEVTGDLTISGSNITDLSSLSSLTKVSGKLTIENNPILETLNGLNALESVDIGLYIKNNEALTDFSALSSLKVVGDLTIANSKMRNFDTFSSLTAINGLLLIANNGLLFEIFGPPSLTTMGGGMSISGNGNLHAVRDFESVTTIVGGIDIYENANLIDIFGFGFLTTIRTNAGGYGHITIRKNDALSNIQGFPSLTEVGDINFESNAKLSAINVFRSLPRISGHLNLLNNSSLKFITGFNELTEITGSYGNTIVGLTIVGSSIENLDWLASLKVISVSDAGGVQSPIATRRSLEIKDNAILNNINGLAGVEEQVVNSGPLYITITKNPILTACGALARYFDSLGDDTVLEYSKSGIINISENGPGCTVEEILASDPIGPPCTGNFVLSSQAEVDAFLCGELTGNLTISGTDITNLKSLALLKKITGNLEITGNPNLETLDLPALDIDNGSLSISNNANLKSISGFNNTHFASSISIGGNPKLVSISGFDSLRQVLAVLGGGFGIGGNDALTSLPAFGALTTTPNLRIVNNPALLALDGFPSLTRVIGDFQISNNESLKTIDGFNKLTSISGYPRVYLNSALLIQNNASLETLDGLSSLKSISAPGDEANDPPDPGSVTVYVTGNAKLTQCCALQPLLEWLTSGGAQSNSVRINISENGGGCTLEDILACDSQSVLGYDIVDTSGKFVRHLNEGDILYLDDLKCKGQTIVANTTGQIGSVKFDLNNKFFMMQNAFPYTLTGDNYGTYFKPWIPQVGAYTLTATPYSKSDAGGDAGQPLTIHFTVEPGTAVVSYDIVNTSGQVLRRLNEGDILYLDDLKRNGQTIVANATGQIGSVKFNLNNKFFMMQNAFPYTLTGDNYGTYFKPWIPHPGAYTLTATPYSKPDAAGCAGQPLTIHFTVKPKSSIAVVSYDIVNISGQFVRRLNEGDILYLDDLKGQGQTIVANTKGQIGSVKFDVNNKFFMMQNAFPYTLTGDNYGTYFKPWIPKAGSYTLTATPYSKSDAGGNAGQSLTIHLTVKPETARAVVSYDIVNISGKVLRRLNEGDILYLDDLKRKGQTIVANTKGQIGSVKFDLNNKFFMMQNAFPYTLTGDNYGTYFKPWIPKAGAYTLNATPYSKADAGGDAGRPLAIHFTVADINNAASRMIATGMEEDIPADDGASDVTIYPVPVENELFVKMDDTVGKDAMLYILTLQGVNVYNGTYSQSSSISTVDLKPGVYFLQVVSRNGFRQHVKFIKK